MNIALIRAKCKERGLTIAKFEEEAGLSNGTVGKWEKAACAPRADTLKRAADYFGLTVDELLADG